MAFEGPNELLHFCRPIFALIVSLFFLDLRVLGGLGKFSSLLPHVLVNELSHSRSCGWKLHHDLLPGTQRRSVRSNFSGVILNIDGNVDEIFSRIASTA